MSSHSSLSSSCRNCDRLRDELLLLKHQMRHHRASLEASTTYSIHDDPSASASTPPPLLYQLTKGLPPRRSQSPVPASVPPPPPPPPPAPAVRLPQVNTRRATPPLPSARKESKPVSTKTTPPSKPPTCDVGIQTSVVDVSSDVLLAGGHACDRCICCKVKDRLHSSTVPSSSSSPPSDHDDCFRRLNEARQHQQRLESEKNELIAKLRTMRRELNEANQRIDELMRKPTPQQPSNSDPSLQLLRHQHDSDQQTIARLQLRIRQLEQRSTHAITTPAAPSSSSSSSVTGPSTQEEWLALQRHQRDIRDTAEGALLKLKQLFPNQAIGT